jgi:tRNA pseudouridine65 synthase
LKTVQILYEDQSYIAIHKPAGLLVHPSKLDYHEKITVVQILREQLNKQIFPVHRLDKPTSGVMIFALNSNAAEKLASQFRSNQVQKKYIALVRGHLKQEQLLDYPLKEELDAIADRDSIQERPAQQAQTYLQPIEQVEIPVMVDRYPTTRYSLVFALPKTGRKHQIRRHLRHLNHPIIGDVAHGCGEHNKYFQNRFQKRRLFLSCLQMTFFHYDLNQSFTIQSELCQDFKDVIQDLGFKYGH